MERQTRLNLDLGGEQIELVRIEASEGLSEGFVLTLDVLATLGEVDLLPHLGKPAAVTVLEDDEVQRHFHGLVADARFIELIEGAGFLYRLTVRPASFFHEQGRNFRIFQDMGVRDIVKKVLDQCGIDFAMRLSGPDRIRSYCVQYGESDFSFVCRLMEEEGLYYFYLHDPSRHTLVICNNPGAHLDLAHATVAYNPRSRDVFNTDSATRSSGAGGSFVSAWHEYLSSGSEAKVTLRDYDFMQPSEPRKAAAEEDTRHKGPAIEFYAYPGRFYQDSEGEKLGTFVLEARRAGRVRYSGEGQFHEIQCGFAFTLERHPIGRFNRRYTITRCRHSVEAEQYRAAMNYGGGSRIDFEAIPADVQYRAPQVTRRPVALGPETAVITGPPGEEIHVDKYGRVKVQFTWDREGRLDDNSSCWIRVSQTGGLGNIILPRIGHEVLIDFINGDPDRPIVVGRVFNESHMPLYELPAHKTKALWRTKTYGASGSYGPAVALDTGAPRANELRFEDKGGSEEVFLHAERDMNTRVRHEETHHVGKDQFVEIGQNRKEKVGSDETIEIGKNRTEKVGTDETIQVGRNRSVQIGQNDTLKVGQKLVIEAGTEIEIKAGAKITISVGSSKIVLDPSSITENTVQLKMSGSATAEMSAAMTKVQASGVLTAQGALVKIN
ncbi:MAG: type VI secretion system tip protein TssI/VgrG [Novosphingobium sp.]